MQVTFTGIKNIGFIKTSIDYANLGIIKENDQGWKRILQMPGPDFQLEEGYLLNMQLTDDFNGKHYTEFQKALEKSHLKTSNFRNPIHKNFLNIFFNRELSKEDGNFSKESSFFINDEPLELDDKNLPLFTYIGKLIRDIAHKPLEKFVVTPDYLESDELNKGMCIGDDLKAIFGKDFQDEVKKMHKPSDVRNCASEMDDFLTSEMMDYFNK